MAIYYEDVMNLSKELKGKQNFDESMALAFENVRPTLAKLIVPLSLNYQTSNMSINELRDETIKIVNRVFSRLNIVIQYYLNEDFLDEYNNNYDTLEARFIGDLTTTIVNEISNLRD